MSGKRKSHTNREHGSKRSHGGGSRLAKGVFSTVILSALVLGVVYFVKFVSTLTPEKIYVMSKPLLSKVGVDHEQAAQVAGKFTERVSQTDVSVEPSSQSVAADQSERVLSFSVAFASDSHNFNGLLNSMMEEAKNRGISTMVYVGDYTDYGDQDSLQNAKEVMDSSELTYYSLPGDHDLAQTSSLDNYEQVFGKPNETFEIDGYKFVLFDNSANFTSLTKEKMDWFEEEVIDADFVVLSQPLFTLSGVRTMGVIDGETTQDVKAQADKLLELVRNNDVKAVFAGDLHAYSNLTDPEKPELRHVVVGAVKASKFVVLDVYENGEISVDDILF